MYKSMAIYIHTYALTRAEDTKFDTVATLASNAMMWPCSYVAIAT